jgi:AcrR family transcriptional regulator
MPRIRAATVAEHREMQRRALLDAARDLVVEGGMAALNFPALAKATGLARSSVYEYFKSRADVVEALIAHECPAWIGEVRAAMAAEPTAERQLAAYVRRQLDLVSEPRHRALLALSGQELDGEARNRISAAHGWLLDLGVNVLKALGHPEPRLAAVLTQGAVEAGAKRIALGANPEEVKETAVSMVLFGGLGGARRHLQGRVQHATGATSNGRPREASLISGAGVPRGGSADGSR